MKKNCRPVIYIAGPYTSDTRSGIDNNIEHAKKAALELSANGWAPITPHLNLYHFEDYEICGLFDYTTWMDIDVSILMRCDAIFMLKGWEHSKGSTHEHALAEQQELKIYYETHGFPDA